MPGLVFLPALAIAAIVGSLAYRWNVKTGEAWQRAASALAMELTPGGMFQRRQIVGDMGQLMVRVDSYTQSSNNSRRTYTRYRISYPALGLGLRLSPQNALTNIFRIFGAQDIEVGDQQFDDTFVIKADADPGQVTAFLTPARRLALTRLFSLYRFTTVADGEITVVTSGMERQPQTIVSTVRRVGATARRLMGIEDETAVNDLIERRLTGDLASASRDLGAVVHPHPDDLDGRLLEMETLAAAGRRDEAASVAEELSEVLPGDREVDGWRDFLAREEPSADELAGRGELSGGALDAFYRDLFASDRLSFETSALFQETYAGRTATLEGKVRSARHYDHDADFGEGPGAKAVITVATIEHDLYGQTEIDAVIALPPAAADLSRGRPVTVRGTLRSVDPLMRNVYLTDGELT